MLKHKTYQFVDDDDGSTGDDENVLTVKTTLFLSFSSFSFSMVVIISVLICYSDYGVCFHMLICTHTHTFPLNYGKASAKQQEQPK